MAFSTLLNPIMPAVIPPHKGRQKRDFHHGFETMVEVSFGPLDGLPGASVVHWPERKAIDEDSN
jgi:hypothetical protein